MKKFFKYIKADRLLFWSFVLSAVFLFVGTLLIAIFYRNLPPFLPLFNELPWGYARAGYKAEFFIPIAIAWGCVVLNCILSSVFYTKLVLLARFLGAATIAVSLSVLIFIVEILYIIH